MEMPESRRVNENGEAEFPYLPACPFNGRFSGIASVQTLYSNGTYEWHDTMVADAYKRPPADYAAQFGMMASMASHAAQTLSHNLAKEVARLREEARTAGGAEQLKALEAARDKALEEVQAGRAQMKKLEEEKKRERERRKKADQEVAAAVREAGVQRGEAAAARAELEAYQAGEAQRLERARRDERRQWYWFYIQATSRGFENCRKQLNFLNPGLNEAGIDYTFEVLPDGRGGEEIRMRADDDEPGEPMPDLPEDWTIHALEVQEGRSPLRPGDDGYVPPADVQSTAGNEPDAEQMLIVPDGGGAEGSGEHAPGDGPVILDD